MTLFKQISLLVSAIFLILASIIVINDLKRTGEFLQGQLQTTAQDMTTTLGIAISNLPSVIDEATLEVLFNSVFDSGYYSRIQLVAVDGSIIHQKNQQISIQGIPDWFLQLVPLTQAEGSTQVMKGWSQLGVLKLSLHPGYAYSGLYNALVSTLKWFVLLFLAAILVLWISLKYLLRPLQRVKNQADSIHRNHFILQQEIPRTVELKSVVEAMNSMVSKVQAVFTDQEQTLSRYQQILYNDKLTGLGNRRYMLDQLQQSLAEQSSFHGSLGVIKMINLDKLRDRSGYEQADLRVKSLAELIIQKHADKIADKTARLSDDEFSFLIATDEDSMVEFINNVFNQYKNTFEQDELNEEVELVAGVAALESNLSMGDLLAGIDYCLSQAVSDGPYSIERRLSSNLDLPKGKMQWRTWLDDILKSNRLFLVGQLVMDLQKNVVQKELFIRACNEKKQIIPASAFMPMASGLGLAIDIDKKVFQLVSNSLSSGKKIPLAVNLSASFFELAEAREEFDQLLSDCHDHHTQLCVEASHHILLHHPDMCGQVSERVKKFGHQFGIDNLDPGLSLQILKTAQFDYVKINASTLSKMGSDEMSSAYQALKTLTDTLNIKIIAVAVDSQSQFDHLERLGIQVMQGNFLSQPMALE